MAIEKVLRIPGAWVALTMGVSMMSAQTQDEQWGKLMAAGAESYTAANYAEALKHYQAAAKLAESFGLRDVRLGRSLLHLGRLTWGNDPAQESLLTRAFAILEKGPAPDAADVDTCLDELQMNYWRQGKPAEEEQVAQRLLEIRERTLGLQHDKVAAIVLNLGSTLSKQRRYSEVERLYTRWLEAAEKPLGPDHTRVIQVVHYLAELYEEQGRYEQAEPLRKRLLATEERLHGPKSRGVPPKLELLARLYEKQGRYKEAEELLRHSLEIGEKEGSIEAAALQALSPILRKTGRTEEAARAEARAKQLHDRSVLFRDDDD